MIVTAAVHAWHELLKSVSPIASFGTSPSSSIIYWPAFQFSLKMPSKKYKATQDTGPVEGSQSFQYSKRMLSVGYRESSQGNLMEVRVREQKEPGFKL